MKRITGRRGTTRRCAIVFIGAVALLLLAAVPALAAPAHQTSLTATAGVSVVKYGGGVMLWARLKDTTADAFLGGQWVRVEQATSASGPWELLYLVTTSSGTYASGIYSAAVLPTQNTWYRFVFEGTSAYDPKTSNVLAIGVKPLLGKPGCPASIKHGKKFTVKGSLKPRFLAGAKTVKVRAYKMNSHKKWAVYPAYWAKNYNYKSYTQYKVSFMFSKKGKYRFRAYTTAKSAPDFTPTKSAYSRVLTVK